MAPSPRSPLRVRSALLLVAAAVLAQAGVASATPRPGDAGLVTVSAGRSGFRNSRVQAHLAFAYHFPAVASHVRPLAGVLASTRGDALLFGGLSTDVPLVAGWGLTPLLSTGYYAEGGGSPLGGALEFRSGIELWRALGRFSRVGVSIDHISNAGLFDHNPGRETVFLSFGSLR